MPDRPASTALELLDSLTDDQRRDAQLPLDDDAERRTWFYWPSSRRGLALGAMTSEQAKHTHHLVADVLSRTAVAKVNAIIGLENVLDEIEERQGSRRGLPRDPILYYLSVFGEPSATKPWSFRFEGHHVSIHITLHGDEIRCTPCFLGANPAVVRHNDRVVTRPLGEEEDAARELMRSLFWTQQDHAIVSEDAPDDILTVNSPSLDALPDGGGLPASGLVPRQRRLLEDLVAVYVERMRPDIAGREMDRLRPTLDATVFAWAGPTERGERHYYRLTGPTLLIEYDNTQDDANHIHAVWRDLERDFGGDILRAHVARDHA
jgi:hypothetical protein